MTVLRKLFVGKDGSGVDTQLLTDSAGRPRIAQSQLAVANGSYTALNNGIQLAMDGYASFVFNISGTFVGTVTTEQSFDGGTTWVALITTRSDAVTSPLLNTTIPSILIGVAPGATHVRARVSAYTSGTIVINGSASSAAITPVNNTHAVSITGTPSWLPGNGTLFSFVTAATTNAQVLSAANNRIESLEISNLTAATIYVKLYNKTTTPTVGTDIPIATIPVAAGAFVSYGFGAIGKYFNIGVGIAVTGAAAATDTTAVAAGAQISGTRS